jgi:hypothetical protein
MKRIVSIFLGLALILFGALVLLSSTAVSFFDFGWRWWQIWRLWPLVVIGLGGLLLMPLILDRKHRGLGTLFIPAMPVLVTGGLLFYASLFDAWGVWAYLWPLEIIALALGFASAALYSRLPWLAFPGVIIGLHGLAFLFSSLTGWWSAWSVLWTVAPLSIGLAFAVVGVLERNRALTILGLGLCSFAALAFTGISLLIFSNGWFLRLLGPALIILVGVLFLVVGFIKRPEPNRPQAETGRAQA